MKAFTSGDPLKQDSKVAMIHRKSSAYVVIVELFPSISYRTILPGNVEEQDNAIDNAPLEYLVAANSGRR